MEASRDLQQRVVGAAAAEQVAAEHGDAGITFKRRWRFFARDNVAVPAALNCDIAFGEDVDELRWLRGFDAFLADPGLRWCST